MNIITANSLKDGLVVFQTASGWTLVIDQSETLETKDDVAGALERAMRDAAANRVVEPYAIEAARDGVHIVPTRLREKIRAAGPTTGNSKKDQAAPATCGQAA
jgi:Protein of unknown function (DUF2849)